tara:strand:+ start:336 stop:1181 length:846 start_codon:yes stop_codon:yes gene_type:complete
MILPDFILQSRVNACWNESGIDSIKRCLDKTHFKNYPHKVEYSYNSRGFRGAEWPDSVEELTNAIWCIGDSFTVGVGSPLEHTWPYLLQQRTRRRCINVSMDGASNEWIARKTQEIIKQINPTDIVIMWSYPYRRENKNLLLSDEDRRIDAVKVPFVEDFVNFKSCIDSVAQFNVKHTAIPHFSADNDLNELVEKYNDVKDVTWPSVVTNDDFSNLPLDIVTELINDFKVYDRMLELSEMVSIIDYCKSVHDLLEVEQSDYARDYYHFDLVTAKWLVEQIC